MRPLFHRAPFPLALVIALLAAPSASALVYLESIDGDIPSFDESAPTPLGTLDPGDNLIAGRVDFDLEFGDVFSVSVPAGHELRTITLTISGYTGEFIGAANLFATSVFQPLDFGPFTNDGVHVSVATPLPAPGPYGFTTTGVGEVVLPASYDWRWDLLVPEPGGTPIGMVAVGALGGLAALRRHSSRQMPRRSP